MTRPPVTVGEREAAHVQIIADALGVTVDALWQQSGETRPHGGQGFAALPASTVREIAYAASQRAKHCGGHRWTSEEARAAAKKRRQSWPRLVEPALGGVASDHERAAADDAIAS